MQKVTITIESDGISPIMFGVDEAKGKDIAGNITEVESEEDATLPQTTEYSPELRKRYETATDLMNVCEYLEAAEVEKLKIIISECERRAKNK